MLNARLNRPRTQYIASLRSILARFREWGRCTRQRSLSGEDTDPTFRFLQHPQNFRFNHFGSRRQVSTGVVQGNEHPFGARLHGVELRSRVGKQGRTLNSYAHASSSETLPNQPLLGIILEVLQISGRQGHELVC